MDYLINGYYQHKFHHILAEIDFSNAFNSLRCRAFLNPNLTLYPRYSQFIFDYYASPSHLQFRDRLISSSDRIQQGDPLGSFLFCLGINSIIQGISEQCKLNSHNWYIDNGILGNPVDGYSIGHRDSTSLPAN
ncbi:unnamed protein product [Gordionus sp. m RMFG-2023]